MYYGKIKEFPFKTGIPRKLYYKLIRLIHQWELKSPQITFLLSQRLQ